MGVKILSWMFFFQSCVFGQYTYVYNRYSVTDGLNTNKVNCVWQDKKGFLWIGTEVGIQRFDGRKFVSINNNNVRLPPSLGINQIIEAEDGNLWLVQGSQVGKLNPFNFQYSDTPIKILGSLPPRSEYKLFNDSKGRVFLCASKYGLLWYDSEQAMFVETEVPISVPEGWGVNGIYEDSRTGTFFITSDKGLAIFDSTTGELFYNDNNPDSIPLLDQQTLPNANGFIKAQNGTWWITYWDYTPNKQGSVLLHYDPEKMIMLSDTTGSSPQLDYVFLNQRLETRMGQVWIGGDNSLISYEKSLNGFKQQIMVPPVEFGLRAYDIRHLFEDREGNIWVSTENGLFVVNPNLKDVYNLLVIDGMEKESAVNSLLETQNQENWIGTWGSGLLFYDANFQKMEVAPYSQMKKADFGQYGKIWSLCQHSSSAKIWVASQGGTLAVFDPDTKKALHWLLPPIFDKSTVRQIAEDPKGNLWFGTQGGHLVKWDQSTTISDSSFQSVYNFNTIIYRLFFDLQGRLWVGTHKQGVYVIDPENGKQLLHFDKEFCDRFSVLDNSIGDIQQYNDSIFFLGSEVLNVLNIQSGLVKRITAYEGLNGSKVSQMLVDTEGILWMITNNGLASYNYSRDNIISYNHLDGIIYGERSNAAKWKMNNGELWFGGDDVVFGFDPKVLKHTENPPNVTVTDFKLFNRFIPLDSLLSKKTIKLKPYQNTFTFYFSALNFNQQNKLQYYYRIPGINTDWVRAERELAANYTTVPPGSYTFQVKSRNLQGAESETVTAVNFTILPPFYASWWFISLLTILVVSLVYLIYRLRVNKLLAVEKLRNKVARDLHDDMGTTLSTISILSTMAKSKMVSDINASSNYLSKITDNSQRMMEAMDDIVWSIKPDNDGMNMVLARMREYGTGVLEAKEIGFDFVVEERINSIKLDMEERRDLFLIYKEAINNAAKYSKANHLKVYIHCEGKRFYMEIKDNGKGFNVHQANSGNGLGNMEKRAHALKGQLLIKSSVGRGTEINLDMPLGAKNIHIFM